MAAVSASTGGSRTCARSVGAPALAAPASVCTGGSSGSGAAAASAAAAASWLRRWRRQHGRRWRRRRRHGGGRRARSACTGGGGGTTAGSAAAARSACTGGGGAPAGSAECSEETVARHASTTRTVLQQAPTEGMMDGELSPGYRNYRTYRNYRGTIGGLVNMTHNTFICRSIDATATAAVASAVEGDALSGLSSSADR